MAVTDDFRGTVRFVLCCLFLLAVSFLIIRHVRQSSEANLSQAYAADDAMAARVETARRRARAEGVAKARLACSRERLVLIETSWDLGTTDVTCGDRDTNVVRRHLTILIPYSDPQ